MAPCARQAAGPSCWPCSSPLVAGGARLIVDLPVWIYPFAAALGAVIGASLGPLLSLARADGSETGAASRWTPGLTGADAPTGGGEAADRAAR